MSSIKPKISHEFKKNIIKNLRFNKLNKKDDLTELYNDLPFEKVVASRNSGTVGGNVTNYPNDYQTAYRLNESDLDTNEEKDRNESSFVPFTPMPNTSTLHQMNLVHPSRPYLPSNDDEFLQRDERYIRRDYTSHRLTNLEQMDASFYKLENLDYYPSFSFSRESIQRLDSSLSDSNHRHLLITSPHTAPSKLLGGGQLEDRINRSLNTSFERSISSVSEINASENDHSKYKAESSYLASSKLDHMMRALSPKELKNIIIYLQRYQLNNSNNFNNDQFGDGRYHNYFDDKSFDQLSYLKCSHSLNTVESINCLKIDNRDVVLIDGRRPKHFVETILIEDVTGKMSGHFLDGLVNSKHIPNDEVIKNFCLSWKPVFYCVNYLLEKEKLNFEDRKKKLLEGYFIQSSAASYAQFKFLFPSYNDCRRMTDIFNWLTSQAMEHIAPLNSRNKFFNRKLSILGDGIITTSLPKETPIRNRVLFNHDIHHLERKICEAFDGPIYSAYLTTRSRITIKIKQKYKYFPMLKVNMIIDHWSSVEQQVMKEKIIISKLQNAFYLPNMLWISDDDYYIYFAYPFATISTMNSFLKYLIRSSSRRKQKLFPLDWLRHIMAMVFCAISELEMRDIVHGGIEPNNILVTENGRILLSNFGRDSKFAQDETRLPFIQHDRRTLMPECKWPQLYDWRKNGKDYYDAGILMVNCLFYEKPDYFPIPLAPWDERYEFLFNSSMGRQTTVKDERDLYQLISQLIFFNPVYRIKCFDDIRKSNFFQNVSWDDYLKGDYLKNCPNDFLEIISRLKLNLHRSNSYYDLNIHNKYINRQIGHRLLIDGKGRYVFPDNAFSAFRNEMRIKCDQPPSNFDSYKWISFMGSDTIANYPISLRYECSELENMLSSIERNSFIS